MHLPQIIPGVYASGLRVVLIQDPTASNLGVVPEAVVEYWTQDTMGRDAWVRCEAHHHTTKALTCVSEALLRALADLAQAQEELKGRSKP